MDQEMITALKRGYHNLGVAHMAQSMEQRLPLKYLQDDEFMLAFRQAKEEARKEIEKLLN